MSVLFLTIRYSRVFGKCEIDKSTRGNSVSELNKSLKSQGRSVWQTIGGFIKRRFKVSSLCPLLDISDDAGLPWGCVLTPITVCHSICRQFCRFVILSVCHSVCLSFRLFVILFVCLFNWLSFRLFVILSVWLLPVYHSICLSFYPISLYLFVIQSVCRSICLSFRLFVFCLSFFFLSFCLFF